MARQNERRGVHVSRGRHGITLRSPAISQRGTSRHTLCSRACIHFAPARPVESRVVRVQFLDPVPLARIEVARGALFENFKCALRVPVLHECGLETLSTFDAPASLILSTLLDID